MNVKDIAGNYIFGLMLSCSNADEGSIEYHDAKAALEDLDGLVTAVHSMTSESDSIETIAHYCTLFQKQALELI